MAFQIEPIGQQPQFIEQLALWHDRQWRHLNPPEYTIEERIKEYRHCIGSNSIPFMLVAHEQNKPLGSVRLINDDMDTHPEWYPWMASLYVDKTQRGRGIGSALIEQIARQAQLFGFDELYLYTEDQQDLYAKHGWKIISEEMYYGKPVIVMKRDLRFISR